MTSVVEPTSILSQRLSGRVIVEGDAGYDEARRVWNAEFDRRPAVIAMCRTAQDVAAAIGYAREHSLEIAVRGGAHSIPGMSSVDGGMMINLGEMDAVAVDPVARRARVGGGALLAQLDAATQEHGLAVPAGTVSHTGVGGLILGGGMGWLTHMLGLSIDSLVAAEVVVADGRVLRAADDENPDLFWAIRGGGGNFGVVTEFEFALHPVGPNLWFSMLFYPLEQAVEAMRVARDAIAALPREANLVVAAVNAPPAPFVPPEHHFRPGYAVMLAGFGSEEEHAATVDRTRAGLAPLFEMSTPMPYTALQQMIDDGAAWGLHTYEKSLYLPSFTDEVIGQRRPVRGDAEDESLQTSGAVGRERRGVVVDLAVGAVEAHEDDLGERRGLARYLVGDLSAERAWVRGFHEALTPLGVGRGVYLNAIARDEPDRVRDSFGAKYDRLAAIKAVFDPDNVFHRNANIAPA